VRLQTTRCFAMRLSRAHFRLLPSDLRGLAIQKHVAGPCLKSFNRFGVRAQNAPGTYAMRSRWAGQGEWNLAWRQQRRAAMPIPIVCPLPSFTVGFQRLGDSEARPWVVSERLQPLSGCPCALRSRTLHECAHVRRGTAKGIDAWRQQRRTAMRIHNRLPKNPESLPSG
jgi:hypothetical protein